MIRRLKIKFVCINMLIVMLMLLMIFSMVLYNTKRDMESQGFYAIDRIHEMHVGKPLPRGEWMDSFFVVHVSDSGACQIFAQGIFEDYDHGNLLSIAMEARKMEGQRGVLREHNLRFVKQMTPAGEILAFMDTLVEARMMKGLFVNMVKIFLVSFFLFLGISILLAQWAIHPVEKAWNTQRQFVADASHELKTPLTVIMTNAEILQDKEIQENQFVTNILQMSRQMRGLVEGLLNLSRVDNGIVKTTFSPVNFTALVENALLPFEPVFFENRMKLESDLETGIILQGSAVHLRQVVEILLDNAGKYGKPEYPVRTSLTREGKYAQLRISTVGNAISQQDLKNIFKRFYRIDKARTMNQSYGLGLSIAEAIISDHGGRIWAESNSGINTFYVQIPIR